MACIPTIGRDDTPPSDLGDGPAESGLEHSAPHWSPLRDLAELVDASGSDPLLDPADFDYCGSVERPGLPRIHRYRHVVTRRSLAIDETLHAWRYAPTTPGALSGYLPIPYLAEAIEMLDLVRAGRLSSGTSSRRFVALYSDEAETA